MVSIHATQQRAGGLETQVRMPRQRPTRCMASGGLRHSGQQHAHSMSITTWDMLWRGRIMAHRFGPSGAVATKQHAQARA